MDCETTWKNGFVKIYVDSVDMNGHYLLNGHELEQTPGDNGRQGNWYAVVHGAAKSGTGLSNWTTAKIHIYIVSIWML